MTTRRTTKIKRPPRAKPISDVVRWHIARIHESERHERAGPAEESADRQPAETFCEVTITRSTRSVSRRLRRSPRFIRKATEDRLEWWAADEDASLHGWISADRIHTAVQKKNLLQDEIASSQDLEARRITEDMVFLQFFGDEAALEKRWSALKREPGLPDVTRLANVRGCRWIDFTKPARRMSKTTYLRALGELPLGDDDRGGSYESE